MKLFAKMFEDVMKEDIVIFETEKCANCSREFENMLNENDEGCSCGRNLSKRFQLYAWQKLSLEYSKYFNNLSYEDSGARGFLKYWGLGTGKTISGLSDALAMRPYKKKEKALMRDLVLLIPASLRIHPWIETLLSWVGPTDVLAENYSIKDVTDVVLKRHGIHIIHHNANNLAKKLNELEGGLSDKVILIDEVHNVISQMTTISDRDGKQGVMVLYRKLMSASNHRVIAMSGTVMINSPFEICYLINILRGKELFPVGEQVDIFMKTFYDKNYTIVREWLFYKYLNGIVSYYGTDTKKMPRKIVHPIQAVKMSQRQGLVHMKLEEMDEEKAKSKQMEGREGERLTRIDDVIKRLNRAMILNAHGKLRTAFGFYDATSVGHDDDKTFKVSQRMNSNFVLPLKIARKWIKNADELQKQYNVGMIPATLDIRKIIREEKIDLVKNLVDFSPKFAAILMNMKKAGFRKCMVYSAYKQYGVYPFSMVLEQYGFRQYHGEDVSDDEWKKSLRYALISGDEDSSVKNAILRRFNEERNDESKYIQIILLTQSAKEGISLRGIRQVHIMEPHWNRQLTEQVEGRAIRLGSHSHLPEKKQKVDIFKYMSFLDSNELKEPESLSVDFLVGKVASKKTIILDQMKRILKGIAFDCRLNYSKMVAESIQKDDYVCYKFPNHKPLVWETVEYDGRGNDYQRNEIEYEGEKYYQIARGIYKINTHGYTGEKVGQIIGNQIRLF